MIICLCSVSFICICMALYLISVYFEIDTIRKELININKCIGTIRNILKKDKEGW